jgi:hypothetical protein
MEHCCICGNDLPNRYAVAGRCKEPGCNEPFCSLHWHRSNGYCKAHGYEQTNGNQSTAGKATHRWVAIMKKILSSTKNAITHSSAALIAQIKKLKKDKSPEAALQRIEADQAANRESRELASARIEKLHQFIAEKKKAYAQASPARKRILEAELKSALAKYKATERELSVLLENETVLAGVEGRIREAISYGKAGVTEVQIDELVDEIEEQVSEAEGRLDAMRDLEKAGRRRERESDRESFLDELAAFDEVEPFTSDLDKELAGFEDEPKKETTDRKPDAPLRDS